MASIYRNAASADGDALFEQEQAIRARLAGDELDFAAADAIQNIYRAAAVVRGHAEREVLADNGLTWGGFTALWVLWILGDMESSDLAAECGLAKGTLTGIVTTLEKRDLVSRNRRSSDRRRVEVSLTAKGEELISTIYPSFNRVETSLVDGLSPTEQKALAGALRKVILNAEGLAES